MNVDDIMSMTICENILDKAVVQCSYSSSSYSFSPLSPCSGSYIGVYPPILPSLLSLKGLMESLNLRYEILESAYPALTPEEVSVREQIKEYVHSQSGTCGVEGESRSGESATEHETVVNSDIQSKM